MFQLIFQQTVLREGTEQFDRWVKLPQPIHFKVYLFNVTNPDGVSNGEIPIVNEVGPYIYRQYREKELTGFSKDKSVVSFRQYQFFHFDAASSAPLSDTEPLTLLNVQLNVSSHLSDNGFIRQRHALFMRRTLKLIEQQNY